MAFLWSNVELTLNPYTCRYYNDLLWYLYSIIGLIPIMIITIYKLVYYIYIILRFIKKILKRKNLSGMIHSFYRLY